MLLTVELRRCGILTVELRQCLTNCGIEGGASNCGIEAVEFLTVELRQCF